jgi:ribonuclease HII
MGCFAGDVYVGIVILPNGIDYKTLLPGLNDSKQKTPAQRDVLYRQIRQHALAYATATASVAEIDTMNIYWARFLAVRRALEKLTIKPDYIIIDGNKEIPEIYTPQHAIVKGDAKSISIAAASILAKVERDIHIDELAQHVHKDYDWINNKSYYSKEHVSAIKKHGKTQWHRQKYVEKYLVDNK